MFPDAQIAPQCGQYLKQTDTWILCKAKYIAAPVEGDLFSKFQGMARKKIREYDSKRLLKAHILRLKEIKLPLNVAQVLSPCDKTLVLLHHLGRFLRHG